MRILPFGDRALLLEVGPEDADAAGVGTGVLGARAGLLGAVLALRARVAASRIPGVDDIVPAARTVLVRTAAGALGDVRARLERLVASSVQDAAPAAATEARDGAGVDPGAGIDVEVPIVYDGPDLAQTAQLLGVGVDALVRRHATAVWTVAFTGFAPGFGYLVSGDWPFDVPRLETPRTRVPAGSVGLAAGFCGAYPRATPGGWRLIGSTDAPLFAPDAIDPVLLPPGTRVRFVPASSVREQPADESVETAPPLDRRMFSRGSQARGSGEAGAEAEPEPEPEAAFRIVEPGLLTTVQDLGRPGRASEGIAVSGALDRAALRAANRLVGNAEDAAALEITMGGLRACARRDLWIAVTGGWGPIRIDGHEVDPYEAVRWPAGAELLLDWLVRGARAYLAVRGGVDAVAVAGSRATDTMAGLGPAPLGAGDDVWTRDAASTPIPPAEAVMAAAPADHLEIAVAPGPRADWFTDGARATLFDAAWAVGDHADRVGVRLDGPVLERRTPDLELPSEGMVPGAIQVPPGGRPVILMADGPVTGGYPVIGVVAGPGLDLLAQARPGTGIRFRHARPL